MWVLLLLCLQPKQVSFSHEIITRMTNSTLFTLVLRRTHVIREPCMWLSSPQALRSSVIRASKRCAEGHRLNFDRGLKFFLSPCSRDVDQIISKEIIFLKKLNQNGNGLTLGLQQKSGPLLSIHYSLP